MLRLHKQKGNGILGVLLVIVIISAIVVVYYKHLHWQKLQNNAKILGSQISMVVDALEKRLSFDEDFQSGDYTIKDLINKSCGGNADQDYLPCGFTLNKAISNGNLSIVVSQSQDNPNIRLAKIQTSTIGIKNRLANIQTSTTGIKNTNSSTYNPISYLAGSVLSAAQTTKAFSGNKYLSASVEYALNSKKSTVSANVVANQNNSNIYLKIDGSNKMQNALQFNKELNSDHRMIKYLSSITNDGQDIKIGNQSGVKGNSNVVVNDLTIHSMGDKPLTSLLNNSMPVGSVIAYDGATPPKGYFECNGAFFRSEHYPKLYAVLGTNRLPDLRGQFVRGWDDGFGIDGHRVLGSLEGDAIRNITGNVGIKLSDDNSVTEQTGAFTSVVTPPPYSYYLSNLPPYYLSNLLNPHWHEPNGHTIPDHHRHHYDPYTPPSPSSDDYSINFDASKVVPTAHENRPKNVALMYIIKHD